MIQKELLNYIKKSYIVDEKRMYFKWDRKF